MFSLFNFRSNLPDSGNYKIACGMNKKAHKKGGVPKKSDFLVLKMPTITCSQTLIFRNLFKMALGAGLEPATDGLTDHCSTIELTQKDFNW